MQELILEQRNMFVISLILGAGMGFVYDWLRCLRRIIPHNNFFIALEDIIYWLFWTYAIIDCIHQYNYGSLRGYVFLGIAAGALSYLATISCFLMFCISHILYVIKKCSKKMNKLLKKGVKKVKITLSLSKKSGKKSRYRYGKIKKKEID